MPQENTYDRRTETCIFSRMDYTNQLPCGGENVVSKRRSCANCMRSLVALSILPFSISIADYTITIMVLSLKIDILSKEKKKQELV